MAQTTAPRPLIRSALGSAGPCSLREKSSGPKFLKFLVAEWVIEFAADDPASISSGGTDHLGDAVHDGSAAQFDAHQGSRADGSRKKESDAIFGNVADD